MALRNCPRSGRWNSDRQPVSSSGPTKDPRRSRLRGPCISAVQVDLVREASRRSTGPGLNTVPPVDAPWYPNVQTIAPVPWFVALPTLPLGSKTNAVQGSVRLVAPLPTMWLRQRASKRYPQLGFEEATDARPRPATTLTAALGPFFYATSCCNLAIFFRK